MTCSTLGARPIRSIFAHARSPRLEGVETGERIVVQLPGELVLRPIAVEPLVGIVVIRQVESVRLDKIPRPLAALFEVVELSREVATVVVFLEFVPAGQFGIVVGVGERAADRPAMSGHPESDRMLVGEERVVEVEEQHCRHHSGQPSTGMRESLRRRLACQESSRSPR
jgi:hypothetical protein